MKIRRVISGLSLVGFVAIVVLDVKFRRDDFVSKSPPEITSIKMSGSLRDDAGLYAQSLSTKKFGDRSISEPSIKLGFREPEQLRDPAPKLNEMGIAMFLPDDPLSVILPWYPEAGVISVERWDENSNPLGIPLSPGTPVGMPDPNNPEMKLYFRIPDEPDREQQVEALNPVAPRIGRRVQSTTFTPHSASGPL